MAIIDCISYNGEREILNLRLNILDSFVDRFIIVEAKTTFSGKQKPLYFSRDEGSFKPWWKKITYHIVDENYSPDELELAAHSPNTQGAAHWQNEFLQKESIKKALEYAKLHSDDIVYIGDVDEIWKPYYGPIPAKLKLRVYAYYLDNESNEQFWGPIVARYGDIKNKVLNHLRTDLNIRTDEYYGWHFTSMGGVQEVRRKLNDSYTEESYNTPQVQALLDQRLRLGHDYLGRAFTFRKSGEHWPSYLRMNYRNYKKLITPESPLTRALQKKYVIPTRAVIHGVRGRPRHDQTSKSSIAGLYS